jgi:hypothetical protein
MVECVGCRQALKNGKAYSNHQRACKKYKIAGALCLRQIQLINARKVERSQADQLHGEPQGIDIPIQDLNDELVVVSSFFFLHNFLFKIDIKCRKMLFLY